MTPLESARRIVIAGGPQTGKATLAARIGAELGYRVRSTDTLIGLLAWSDASAEASRWLEEPEPWIIEGVAVPRAIRKWFRRRQDAPCDVAIWLSTPHGQLKNGQRAMAKGCLTVWQEILPALLASGVTIENQQ